MPAKKSPQPPKTSSKEAVSRFQKFEAATIRRREIKNAPYNPRQIGPGERARLKTALEQLGLVETLVWNARTRHLVGGHQRLAILDELEGSADYSLTLARIDVSPSTERKLNLLLNNAHAQGTWDTAKLQALIAEMEGDIALTGFDEKAIDELLAEAAGEKEIDAPPKFDEAEKLRKKYGVQPGQLWQLGDHRLLCGDSTKPEDVARVMAKLNADAVLTDPPYGISQPGVPNDEPEKFEVIIRGAVKCLPMENGVAVAFASTRTFPLWLDEIRQRHKFERMLWLYKVAQCAHPWRGWLLISEAILLSTIGEPDWQDVHPYKHDTYSVSEVSAELPDHLGWHGSVKPIAIVSDILSRICKSGAILYEPFLGSGTTLIACERLGRKCRAIEIEPKYVAVSIERWAEASGGKPKLLK